MKQMRKHTEAGSIEHNDLTLQAAIRLRMKRDSMNTGNSCRKERVTWLWCPAIYSTSTTVSPVRKLHAPVKSWFKSWSGGQSGKAKAPPTEAPTVRGSVAHTSGPVMRHRRFQVGQAPGAL
jgi:hypothetical protein